jgi:hypothetical protein
LSGGTLEWYQELGSEAKFFRIYGDFSWSLAPLFGRANSAMLHDLAA